MGDQMTDLEYIQDMLADFDLQPGDKIQELIDALEDETEDTQ